MAMYISKKLFISYLTGAIIFFSLQACLPERDNPWDEDSDIDLPPSNLVINKNSDSSVTLTWDYFGSPLIEGFVIDRKEDDSPWVEGYAGVDPNHRTFTDSITQLIFESKTWAYRVYSKFGSNFSSIIEDSIRIIAHGEIAYNGYIYKTFIINGREWFAENLRTSTYANGDPIPNVTDNNQWENLTSDAWCYFANDSQYENPYGKLYNWYAVDDSRNVCPTGWHVPTDTEWTQLIDYLGGREVAGGKMKSTAGWKAPNKDASNESGFSGLPGGYRSRIGPFYTIGTTARWWSSTEDGTDKAWARTLFYRDGNVGKFNYTKKFGFSVRCLRD